jgi:alkylated DNA repair dioxygenase AlkB
VDLPEGLVYREDFITSDEEDQLVGALDEITFNEVHFRGVVAKRVVRHFGIDYEYNAQRVRETDPLPDSLEWLRLRCAAFADIEPERLVETLCTRYPPGAGIGWHRDAPQFGSRVVGVSLVAPCRMRFKRQLKGQPIERFAIDLAPRSAYIFSGAARWSWQHSIPAVDEMRYSITFRTLKRDRKSA